MLISAASHEYYRAAIGDTGHYFTSRHKKQGKKTMKESLEEKLMRRYKGLRRDQADKLVEKCRARLEMPKSAEWNNQLLIECERKLKSWRERSKKKKADRMKLEILPTKTPEFGPGDTTSATSGSDDPMAGARKQPSTKPVRQQGSSARPPLPSKSAERRGLISSLFGQDSSFPEEEETVDRFFGQRVNNQPASTKRPSIRKKLSSGRRLPEMDVVSSKPENRPANEDKVDDRVMHLADPTARLMPLEALMRRRFDMKLEDAACLVADARTNLGASKWEPWSDQLYLECEKLYHDGYQVKGAETPQTESLRGWLDFYNQTAFQTNGEDADDDKLSNRSLSTASGWDSTSGWASLFSSGTQGSYSITTHDRDDEYCVGLIERLSQTAALFDHDVENDGDTTRSENKMQQIESKQSRSVVQRRQTTLQKRRKKKRNIVAVICCPWKKTSIHV